MQREAKNAGESDPIVALPSMAGGEEQGAMICIVMEAVSSMPYRLAVKPCSSAILFLVGSKSSKAVNPFFSWDIGRQAVPQFLSWEGGYPAVLCS
jgi:hypothetical protein